MEDTQKPIITTAPTSAIGHIHTSLHNLISTLRLPNVKGNGEQTRIEWHIATPQGSVEIYDWKEVQDLKDVDVWVVGGTSYRVAQYVENALDMTIVGGVLCL